MDLDACIERAYCIPYSDCPAHVGAAVLKALVKFAAALFSDSMFCVGGGFHVTPSATAADHSQQHTVTANIGGRLSNMFTAYAQVTFVQ